MKGATVTVVGHSKNFTTVSNKYLQDKNLSFKAKGLLTVILSLANNPDWDFSVRGLIQLAKEGETAVYATIKELKETGYCKSEQVKDPKTNRIITVHYSFFEEIPEK